MKTITLYTVARTPGEAERMLVDEEYRKLGRATLFTQEAAEQYRASIVGKAEMRIFPMKLTVEAGEPLP